MQRMSVQEYRSIKRKPRSKYGNKKVELGGNVFDSKVEARYYQELRMREMAGDILFFRLQPRYLLQESFTKDGKTHRRIDYIADFEVHHKDGSIEVVDVKGVATDVFRMKEKMFHARYPHKLSVITYDYTYGWMELDELKKIKRG